MMYVIKKDIAKIVILVVLAVAFIGATFVFTNVIPPKNQLANVAPSNVTISVQDVYAQKSVPIARDETILQLLQALNISDPQLMLATNDYKDMGTLITAMGKHKNGDAGKYWQYKVNGTMPQIAADTYKLQGGENIEWYFATSKE